MKIQHRGTRPFSYIDDAWLAADRAWGEAQDEAHIARYGLQRVLEADLDILADAATRRAEGYRPSVTFTYPPSAEDWS